MDDYCRFCNKTVDRHTLVSIEVSKVEEVPVCDTCDQLLTIGKQHGRMRAARLLLSRAVVLKHKEGEPEAACAYRRAADEVNDSVDDPAEDTRPADATEWEWTP